MKRTNGLLLRFILGFIAPLLAWLLVALFPVLLMVPGPVRWVLILAVVLFLARMGWLPGGFHFFKPHPADHEYGITPPTCHECGYDLRASPEHCPECGSPVNRIDGTIIRYLMSLRRRDVIDATMSRKV